MGATELVARLLSPNEREAVLGDLAEANQNVLRPLFAGLSSGAKGFCGATGGHGWRASAWPCQAATC
jgi:hypothetical protein